MRNMSFMLTTGQFLDGSKTVTRRLGWAKLKPGDRVMAVKKAMGLKKGETMDRLGPIEIVSVTREELQVITPADVKREGFPSMSPNEFVQMFCAHMACDPSTIVTRIEFKRLDGIGA